jgi:hypothetical protein
MCSPLPSRSLSRTRCPGWTTSASLLSWFQRESSDVAVAVALGRGPIRSERSFRGLVLVNDKNLLFSSLLIFAGGKIVPVSSSRILCLSDFPRGNASTSPSVRTAHVRKRAAAIFALGACESQSKA